MGQGRKKKSEVVVAAQFKKLYIKMLTKLCMGHKFSDERGLP